MDVVPLLLAIIGVIGVIAVNMLSAELYSILRPLGQWTIRWSARILPFECQAAREEEWLAHYNELEGNLTKILHALSCVKAALLLRDELELLSTEGFENKSFSYRCVTKMYFVFDCAVDAALVFVTAALYPFGVLFCISEVLSLNALIRRRGTSNVDRPLPPRNYSLDRNHYLEMYYKRRDGGHPQHQADT